MHIFFSKYAPIVSDQAGNNYILPAYIDEFMKYAVDNFHVHFFSAGNKRRNEIVIEKLWQSVFHCTKPDRVRILSRDDITSLFFVNVYNILEYGTKKDITKLGPLDKTILVDDNRAYVIDDQVKNFLQANNCSFETVFRMCENCDGEIYIKMASKIKSVLATGNKDWYDMLTHLAFHKLLHITGVLERAKLHQEGVVEGLADIYFIEGKANQQTVGDYISFSKKGLDVLSEYATNTSCPKLECLENLIF